MPAFWEPGLDVMPGLGVIPHYDRFGPERTRARIEEAPPGLTVLGIDEDTVILSADGVARVLGRGTVAVWRDGLSQVFEHGAELPAELVRLP
jgi:cyanophycinase-like exopeptidase